MIDQYKTLSEKFIRKGFWLYLFSFIIAPIGYVIKIIISGELTVSEVGILYGVLSLIGLLGAFNDFGMSESLNYFIPKYVIKKRYDIIKTILTYALLTQIITGIIITVFLLFGADYIAINYFKNQEASNILKIFSIYFLGINILQVINTFLYAVQNTFLSKLNDFVRMIFTLVIILSVFFLDLGNINIYSIAWIIGLYIGISFASILFYKKYYKIYLSKEKMIWSKKIFRKIFSYAIMVFVGAQASSILGQIDMQMIIYLLGTTDAGYYTNYLSIIAIPFLILGPIFPLLFPIFSELYNNKQIEKIKLIKIIFQKNFIAVSLAFNILFFVFAPFIGYILFGEKFLESGNILRYSILFVVFNFLLQINFNIMAGIGKIKDRIKIILIAIVFNIILNLILINGIKFVNFKGLGVYGAALATGIGWILIWILSEYYLGKKYFSAFDYKFLTKNIIFMGLLGFFSYYFLNPIIKGFSRGISFGIMFIIVVVWFGVFGLINFKEFKVFILEIKNLRK